MMCSKGGRALDTYMWSRCCLWPVLLTLSGSRASSISHQMKWAGANGTDGTQKLLFTSPLAKKFAVPRKLPLVDFEITDTYAGLLDVSEVPHNEMQLFFWFVPGQTARGAKKLTIWTNGGPGCSSLHGAFQEIGPIMFDAGSSKPKRNQYSWNLASHILFLEHPAPVGFSRGNVLINNENQVAEYTYRFLLAWLKVFPEMATHDLFLAGESYGGYYISYIAEHLYAKQAKLSLRLQGILMIDGCFTHGIYQDQVPVWNFVQANNKAFKFNETFMQTLSEIDKKCGYSDFLEKHLKYPPTGPFPALRAGTENHRISIDDDCNIWQAVYSETTDDFDFYNILHNASLPDPLMTDPVYLNRHDVKRAFNVDGAQKWEECKSDPKLLSVDFSEPPAFTVLPTVIAKSVRTVLAHGSLDANLFSEGSKLGIQNMNWLGMQGFQSPVNLDFRVGGQVTGKYRIERRLAFVEVYGGGHTLPHDTQRAGFQIFEFFLGLRKDISS